jgi:hypothetical protein
VAPVFSLFFSAEQFCGMAEKRDRSEGEEEEEQIEKLEEFCTYTQGPNLKTFRPVTTDTILGILQSLKELFGDEHDFEPDRVCEGGILWTRYPGNQGEPWKTLRFHFYSNKGGGGGWPWIKDDTLEKWRNEGAKDIWPLDPKQKGQKKACREGGTFLKALFGAPCWTTQELAKFKKAFKDNGITCSDMPVAFDLKEEGRRA